MLHDTWFFFIGHLSYTGFIKIKSWFLNTQKDSLDKNWVKYTYTYWHGLCCAKILVTLSQINEVFYLHTSCYNFA